MTVELTLASTISTVEITPSLPTINVGDTVQLTATAKDASGATVLVSGFDWSVTFGIDFASVDASGLVTGLASGRATVRATETESGIFGETTVSVGVAPPPRQLCFDQDLQPILDQRCVSCHGGSSPDAGLDLSAGVAYANLLNVPSGENSQFLLVAPGNSADSYLIMKMMDDARTSGRSMRYGLSDADIALFAEWIDLGADSCVTLPSGTGYVDVILRGSQR